MEALITKFEAYLLTERRVAQNTFSAYKCDIAQYVDYLKQQNVTLDAANDAHIKLFIQSLHDSAITPRSVARKISSLKSLYAYLKEHHNYKDHTCDIVIPKLEKKLPQYLSEHEIEQLLTAASESDKTKIGKRNKIMIYLLYVTGMRISELVELKKSAIHFDTGFLTVSGKGGKDRLVPLPEYLLPMLKNYLEEIHPKIATQNRRRYDTDFLFPTRHGQKVKPISRQAFWVMLKKLVRSIGLRDFISPHKLRHSLATHLLKNGANLRSIQMLLGHEKLATVQIYTHLETGHLRKVYDKKHPRS
jgi:integrase/recombinase XerD